jgi:hypothetical protein
MVRTHGSGRGRHAGVRAPRRWQRVSAALAAIVLGVGGTAVGLSLPASAAAGAGTPLLEDSFTDPTVRATNYVKGGVGFTPCLTAAGSGTSVIGRCAGASDAAGSGALRLTQAVNEQSGFLLYNKALPTKAGLDITFMMYQYAGTAADGISFFLTDGSKALTQAGPPGGSLGYANSVRTDIPNVGLANALLGVGLDAYGNFGIETKNADCDSHPTGTAASYKDTVTVRGPAGADRKSGYCVLGPPTTVPGGIDNVGTSTRGAALKNVRIIVDPPGPGARVKVYVGSVADGATPVTTVPQPAVIGSTPTFKFGWAASTGGQNNIHEINFLKVSSVDPIMPELSLTGSSIAAANAGTPTTWTLTPTTSAAGGPVLKDKSVTIELSTGRPGLAVTGATGTGWNCPAPAAGSTTAACTYTATNDSIAPGSSLPALTATLTGSSTGSYSVSAVASADGDTDASTATRRTATASAVVKPVAQPVTGTGVEGRGVAHATAPEPVTMVPAAPTTTGTPSYALATTPQAGKGTASIDSASGKITFTPKPGASGTSTFTYTVTADGVTSDPAPVVVHVDPVAEAPAGAIVTQHGTPVPVQLSGVGTGLTWKVQQPSVPGQGTVDSDGSSTVTFRPLDGFSGTSTFGVTVTDADGRTSAPVTATVRVDPSTDKLTASVALDENGEGAGVTNVPDGRGSGRLTYAIVTPPAEGTATVDADTGQVTYTAKPSTSGEFPFTYRVTDEGGLTSPNQHGTVTVHPYGAPVSGSTTAEDTLTLPAPVVHGSGIPTYAVTPSPGTDASVDADGRITFDPKGRSGRIDFTYEVTDGGGISSGAIPVTVDVAPVAKAVHTSAVAADPAEAVVVTLPAATGTGPMEYTVSQQPQLGAASIDGDELTLLPASGWSGTAVVEYTATGVDGIASAPAAVTVDLHPVAHTPTHGVESGVPATLTLPTPTGTGPFTVALETLPSVDKAEVTVLDAQAGTVQVAVPTTYSGPLSFGYTVADATSLQSTEASVDVLAAPRAHAVTGTTVSGQDLTMTPEPAWGTGALTWALADVPSSSRGTLAMDATTGELSYDAPEQFSGRVTGTYTVTDPDGHVSAPATISVDVAPVSAEVTGMTALDAHGAASVAIDAAMPTGSGPFRFELVTMPAAGTATAAIDERTGRISLTAARGVSGTHAFSYRAADADGVWSAPKSALVVVAPWAGAVTGTTPADRAVTLEVPAVQGTAPFRYRLETPPAEGKARIDKETGSIRYTPAAGWSGVARFSLAVVDAAGTSSAPAPVTVVVRPMAQTVTAEPTGGSGEAGGGPVSVILPKPKGTGPFEYEVVTGPKRGQGKAQLDPKTGKLVFTPKKGMSGRVVLTYRVTDAQGVVSETSTVAFEVRPVARTLSGRTTGSSAIRMTPAKPTGTGPFTYKLAKAPRPDQGEVTIDPRTGEMVFVPAKGYTGEVSFSYVVVDADGVESLPVGVSVGVEAPEPARNRPTPAALAKTGAGVGGLALLALLLVAAGAAVRRVGAHEA